MLARNSFPVCASTAQPSAWCSAAKASSRRRGSGGEALEWGGHTIIVLYPNEPCRGEAKYVTWRRYQLGPWGYTGSQDSCWSHVPMGTRWTCHTIVMALPIYVWATTRSPRCPLGWTTEPASHCVDALPHTPQVHCLSLRSAPYPMTVCHLSAFNSLSEGLI